MERREETLKCIDGVVWQRVVATTRKADECVMNDFIWEITGWGMSGVHKGNYINEAFEHSNKDLNPVYKYYGIGTGWGCEVEREF